MIAPNALQLFRHHAPLAFGWCEVVVGYDFGILTIREIQEWVRSMTCQGREAERLAGLDGPFLLRFEETLWAACREGTGKQVPRPGHQQWALAQDLWRTILLKEALQAPLSTEAFAEAVETIFDHVGCPEDMLGLLSYGSGRSSGVISADRAKVEAFVHDLEARLFPDGYGWSSRAVS